MSSSSSSSSFSSSSSSPLPADETVVQLVAAVFAPDADSDPDFWKEFSGAAAGSSADDQEHSQQQQQLSPALQNLLTEMSFFRGAATPSKLVSRVDERSGYQFHSADAKTKLMLAARHRGIMRRVVVARAVFRSVMQPSVSNLLQAGFRSSAATVAKRIMEEMNDDENATEDNETLSSAKKQLSSVAAALSPIASIRCRHPLLKLLYEHKDPQPQQQQQQQQQQAQQQQQQQQQAQSTSHLSLHSALCACFRAAGFILVGEDHRPVDESRVADVDYLTCRWQWKAAPVLVPFAPPAPQQQQQKVQQQITKKQIKIAATFLSDALATLRNADKQFLSRIEKYFDRGGVFSADRVSMMEMPWLLIIGDASQNTSSPPSCPSKADFFKTIKQFLDEEADRESETDAALRVVGDVLASRNEARKASQHSEAVMRFEAAKEQAQREREAHERAAAQERERQRALEAEHEAAVASVQHLLPKARQTLHETGRVRNASFHGVMFKIQPMRVRTRIQLCKQCDVETGLELHWHLRAAPNVIYAFTAHLSADASKLIHLGDEIGYQYDTLPGTVHFGKTVMINRKQVSDAGQLLSIDHEAKEVSKCVCGTSFTELWE